MGIKSARLIEYFNKLEEQKMSEKLHVRLGQAIKDRDKIDEEVRRLEKRIKEEEQTKIPMVRRAISSFYKEDRIIIKITKKMKDKIKEYSHSGVFVFDKNGKLCNHWPENNIKKIKSSYNNIETLFEGDLE